MSKEYIEREAAIEALVGLTIYDNAPALNAAVEKEYHNGREWIGGVRDALIEIGDIPAADVVERPRWIPVTERLPDIGRNCLISPVSGCVAEGQFDGDGWTQYRWSAKWDKDAVTHWMPLPEPPKEDS